LLSIRAGRAWPPAADNTIRLWDVAVATRAGGQEAPDAEVAELRGHDAYVHAVDWSPDGTRLISASGDGTVRVWDSLSAQERARRGGGGKLTRPHGQPRSSRRCGAAVAVPASA
jgi:hypothetical protein